MRFPLRLLVSLSLCALAAFAQIDQQRLNNAAAEPQNWLTYHGGYMSRHHSGLAAINPANVSDLEIRWVHQAGYAGEFQTTPLVVDGVMYLTEPTKKLMALDALSGRKFWVYRHRFSSRADPRCGRVNRGAAMLGNTLYWGTLDAKLLAVDARTGLKQWETAVVEDHERGYSLTAAPLIVNGKVIISAEVIAGAAGGEFGARGFLAAYDAETGGQVWKFHTIPGPGEPGHETWENDAWKTGGGSIWLTGSYDPDLNLTYWGVGNPSPTWNPDVRPGGNLYTDSVIALDADSGELQWHFQFTPHDEWGWDSAQTPVLTDLQWQGETRKLMLWANRNGFYYVLDRETGEFLMGKPFVKQTWAAGLDEDGRPAKIPGRGPSKDGSLTLPGVQGATSWCAPSYSPVTGLLYLMAQERSAGVYYKQEQKYEPGVGYQGCRAVTKKDGNSAVYALNPLTGEKVWEFAMTGVSASGLLTTASNLLFAGNREGYFFALDARDGKLLWRRYLGGETVASPITYAIDGEQFVAAASGRAVFTFALPR